ncbi:MAG TPA: hypothetical protein VGO47_15075, partial [Chlamydiales bacterium]|nr:hypothetical protein [Chlamydiales bacterium]
MDKTPTTLITGEEARQRALLQPFASTPTIQPVPIPGRNLHSSMVFDTSSPLSGADTPSDASPDSRVEILTLHTPKLPQYSPPNK